jgi:anaerobic selenocysteine-containing dehydrogenase
MDAPPTSEELLALMIGNPAISLADIQADPRGRVFDLPPQFVEPARPGCSARFEVMPPDVAEDLAAQARLLNSPAIAPGATGAFILASRRMRDSLNSLHAQSPSVRGRVPHNPLFMNPTDAERIGSRDGSRVRITSDHGSIEGVVRADPSVREGVVQMSHCFGGLPGDGADQPGACTNLLVSTDRDVEQVNAMPRQSGIPVIVRPLPGFPAAVEAS